MNIEQNEPAFPINIEQDRPWYGLTKREYFAAMAMASLAGAHADGGYSLAGVVARQAVENADALIAELNK